MKGHVGETLVGLVVVVVAASFLGYALTLKDTRSDRNGYELQARFGKADGINAGTDVRMAGVKVGTVARVDYDPKTFTAVATLRVQPQIEVPTDSTARIASEGLLGGNHVAIEPGGEMDNLKSGDVFENTQGSLDLLGILGAFAGGQKNKADTAAGPAMDEAL